MWAAFDGIAKAIDELPTWEDWRPHANIEFLLRLNAKASYSDEQKRWFRTQLTEGHGPTGIALGDLEVSQEHFGDPVKPLRERMQKDINEMLQYLKVIVKMFKLKAVARVPETDTHVAGVRIVILPNFLVYNKDKPRLVSNYAERVRIPVEILPEGFLDDWLSVPANRLKWTLNNGFLSYNDLIPKEQSTLSYLGLEDLAALLLAMGDGAYLNTSDVSGAFYQMRQTLKRLAYQVKVIPCSDGTHKRLQLMGCEMGDGSAPSKGNLDTATHLRLVQTYAQEQGANIRFEYRTDELTRPSAYGLNNNLSPHILEEKKARQRAKIRHELECMHFAGRRWEEFRFKKKIWAAVHYADDNCNVNPVWDFQQALKRGKFSHVFMQLAGKFLSTEFSIPTQEAVFCGWNIQGPTFGFTAKKWERYTEEIHLCTHSEVTTGKQIEIMCGILANAAQLFEMIKIPLALVSHHFSDVIRAATAAKTKRTQLQVAWRKLLKKHYRIHHTLKKVIWETWLRFKGKRTHARKFVLTIGDARDEDMYSSDASPQGIGFVNHYTGKSWGTALDPEKSPLITRKPFGKVASATFEVQGPCLMMATVPELQKKTQLTRENPFKRVVGVYLDNIGAQYKIHPTNPKLSGSSLAPMIWLMRRQDEYGIHLVTGRLDTDTIPADVPSRLYKGQKALTKDLQRRRVLSLLTSLSRRFGDHTLVDGLKGKDALLNHIGSFLAPPRPLNQSLIEAAHPIQSIRQSLVRKLEQDIVKLERKYFSCYSSTIFLMVGLRDRRQNKFCL